MRKIENSFLFLKFEVEMLKKKVDFWREHGEFVREGWTDKTMNSQSERGKTEKVFLKKTVLKAQNTRFSRLKWVANKSLETLVTKFGKICLTIFRDWKFHSRVSCVGSREIFWVTLATGVFTREQVAKLSRVKSKNPYFWKNSKIFSRLELWPTRKSRKPSV